MTIPQIVTWIGGALTAIAGLFTIIHTINLIIPGVDFMIATSHWGGAPYTVSIPVLIVGIVITVIGLKLEDRDERR